MTSNRFTNRIGPKAGFVVPIRVLHRRGSQPRLPISSRMTASGHDPRVGYPREPAAESPPDARTAGYTGRDEEKAPHHNFSVRLALPQSGRRDLTRPAASAAGAGLSPASGAKAPQAPKLNPRPPEPLCEAAPRVKPCVSSAS